MTKIIQYLVIVTIILISTLVKAQDLQGIATYQTKRNFDIKMDSTQVGNEQQKAIQEMIKKQFEKTYTLTFTKSESIYKEVKKLEAPKPQQSGMVIKISGTDGILYKNTKEQTFVNAKEMFGKKFLIKDTINTITWKTEKETKTIGNYLCFKATFTEMIDDYDEMGKKKEKQKERIITAWYTPEIPISNGPKDYQGLPGLILELHEGKMHYVCNKIVMNPKDKIEILAPKKGKEVTQKEFQKIVDKQQKKMLESFQSGRKKGDKNGMTIRIGG